MTNLKINQLITEKKIARALFYHLSDSDLSQCALVSKCWLKAVRTARSHRKLKVSIEVLNHLKNKDQELEDLVRKKYKYATELEIYGWSNGAYIQSELYDNILNYQFRPKKLVLRGRGSWDSCRCPSEGNLCGKQIDTAKEQLTNLESIHVATTFSITACALLDLVSRSPKLKVLRFYGIICLNDHYELFNQKHFHSDLERLFWPWPSTKRHQATISTIAKRNENLTTLYSNAATVSHLLAAEALPSLRYLSITLNESWCSKSGSLKKANRHISNIGYLSSAKNVEALEVRTFDMDVDEDSETKVEGIYYNYKIAFWDQVSKLPKLKFLAMYGSWEFEEACRLMAKHNLQVEYLKINLTPNSVLQAVDAQDDAPILSMVDGIRNLKKLTKLESLHYICHDKLGSIDNPTVSALKEIMDLFWVLDIKTGFSEEVEDLLNNIMRRGNQLGKTYKYYIHIHTRLETNLAEIVTERMLKYPIGTILREKIETIAEYETSQRQRKAGYENFHIWGLEQTGNVKDKMTFEKLASNWRIYNDQFSTCPRIV